MQDSSEDRAGRLARLTERAVQCYCCCFGDPEQHPGNPFVRAYLLAGGLVTHLSILTGVSTRKLNQLAENEGEVMPPDDLLRRLWIEAVAFVDEAEYKLRRKLVSEYSALYSEEVREHSLRLNKAHELTWGLSLFDKCEHNLRALGIDPDKPNGMRP